MLEQTRQGFYEWEIILLALDEYTHYMEKKYEILGRKIPDCFIRYNALNDEFRQLMNDEWNGCEE